MCSNVHALALALYLFDKMFFFNLKTPLILRRDPAGSQMSLTRFWRLFADDVLVFGGRPLLVPLGLPPLLQAEELWQVKGQALTYREAGLPSSSLVPKLWRFQVSGPPEQRVTGGTSVLSQS